MADPAILPENIRDSQDNPVRVLAALLVKEDGSPADLGAGGGPGAGGDASAAKQDTQTARLDSILAKLADPATQTTLAAVLAKLSADPATQTTLAAVLAKLSADPATQTTLAAMSAKLPATVGAKAAAASLPVTLATDDVLLPLLGPVNEGAPASDTASSGLGGRLQRVAQRLTTLIGLFPTSLGAKNGSASMAVTSALDEIRLVDVTLTVDSAAYASGDVIADSQQVANAARANDAIVNLQSLVLIDPADQGVDLYVVFLGANVATGTENAAPSISDANAANYLGHVQVSAADYLDLGGVKVASFSNLGLVLRPATGTRDVYVAVVAAVGSAPTYGASAPILRMGFSG